MRVHISSGNSKVPFANISLRPIADCGNCKSCARQCYALKSYRMYPSTRTAWNENSHIARKNPDKYFKAISAYLSKHNPEFFRWHVAGDILDQDYLNRMNLLAREYPNTNFLCFTKMHDLDYSGIPENMEVVFSMFPSMQTPMLPGKARIAWVQDGSETRIPANAIHCPGNCGNCGMCWQLSAIKRDVYFMIH